jgi:hypothetical protein
MTSGEIRIIRSRGVRCKSDAGLYLDNSCRLELKFLSIYGSPQQVRAVFALLAQNHDVDVVEVKDGEEEVFSLTRGWQEGLRFKSYPLGYGKRHALIFTEELGKEIILWTSPEEKERILLSGLSKRRIPFDRAWLWELEKVLFSEEHLIELKGWGGFQGYVCHWNDDEVCDLIVERILPLYAKKGGKKWN